MFKCLNVPPQHRHSRRKVIYVITRSKALPFSQWFFFSARAAKSFYLICHSTKIYPTLPTDMNLRLQEHLIKTMKADFFSKAIETRPFDFLLS